MKFSYSFSDNAGPRLISALRSGVENLHKNLYISGKFG
jgi:hypothetical protein